MRRTPRVRRGVVIGSVVLLAQLVFAAVNTENTQSGLSIDDPHGRSISCAYRVTLKQRGHPPVLISSEKLSICAPDRIRERDRCSIIQCIPEPRIEFLTNCTPAAIEQFPKPVLGPDLRKQGWLAVHIIIAIYMFVCLSTLCEDYFFPAIEVSRVVPLVLMTSFVLLP